MTNKKPDMDFPPILGVQPVPNHPWIYNKPNEDGEYPPIDGFFDRALEIVDADSEYQNDEA